MGLTFELNILILVAVVISLDLQMFPRILNALRAYPILASTSSSIPPVMFMTLPKYVKDVTYIFYVTVCYTDVLI